MEAIILGNPYDLQTGSSSPVIIPAYESDKAVVLLTDGFNPYIISSGSSPTDIYWTKVSGNILTPITITDKVVIGNNSLLSGEHLRVAGGINITELTFGGESTYVTSIKNENDLASNSRFAIPTQASVKAYVDGKIVPGIQVGDNITLLTNNAGYLTSEVEPLFTASPSFGILSTDITNWNTAFGWGNHATAGYLTSETDPIFTASASFGITLTNIANWNTAYTNTHTHSNKTLLDSLISSGDGTKALFNDGSYKVINVVGGSYGTVQYNNSGIFGGDTSFTFDNVNKRLLVTETLVTTEYFSNTSTKIYKDSGGNLTFTDSVSGTQTLADLISGGGGGTFSSPAGYTSTTVTVGGISSGTSVSSLNGQTINTILQMMMFPTPSNPVFVNPTESISITLGTSSIFNGLYVEKGQSSTMTISGTFNTSNGPGGNVYALVNDSPSYKLNGSTFTNGSSVTFTSASYIFEVDQLFKANGLGEASPEFVVLANGVTVYANSYTGYSPGTITATKTYTVVDPIYYGAFTTGTSTFNTLPTWTEIGLGCTKFISIEPATLNINITTYSGSVDTHKYIVIAYPDSYGLLSHIFYTEGGNNDVIGSFLNTTATYTRNDSSTITYRIYYALNSYSGESSPRTLHYVVNF